MRKKIECPYCGKKLSYDDATGYPGLRDFEDVVCPYCHKKITSVYTSNDPNVRPED